MAGKRGQPETPCATVGTSGHTPRRGRCIKIASCHREANPTFRRLDTKSNAFIVRENAKSHSRRADGEGRTRPGTIRIPETIPLRGQRLLERCQRCQLERLALAIEKPDHLAPTVAAISPHAHARRTRRHAPGQPKTGPGHHPLLLQSY